MPKGKSIDYSAAELEFIQSVSTWPREEACVAFCQKFRRDDVTVSNFHALCKRKGWMTGRTGGFEKGQAPHNKGKKCEPGKGGNHPNARRTQFQKGQQPHNTHYLGHERIDPKDGYVYISIAETNPHTGYERRYVLKHLWLWENANGKLPEGYCLKCLSSDRQNTDPSNWEAIPRAMLPRLAGGNRYNRKLAYDDAPPELKPTVLAIAKLEHKVRSVRKRPNPPTDLNSTIAIVGGWGGGRAAMKIARPMSPVRRSCAAAAVGLLWPTTAPAASFKAMEQPNERS